MQVGYLTLYAILFFVMVQFTVWKCDFCNKDEHLYITEQYRLKHSNTLFSAGLQWLALYLGTVCATNINPLWATQTNSKLKKAVHHWKQAQRITSWWLEEPVSQFRGMPEPIYTKPLLSLAALIGCMCMLHVIWSGHLIVPFSFLSIRALVLVSSLVAGSYCCQSARVYP